MTQLHDVGVQTRQNSLKIGEERVTYLQQRYFVLPYFNIHLLFKKCLTNWKKNNRLEQELGDLNFEKEKIHSLMSKLESLTREQQATLDKVRLRRISEITTLK